MTQITAPKVFISYSWTTPEYQDRVTEFVNRLRDAGVDTVYDKYDLEAGASTHAFMEKSVTDPTVHKVLILCDRKYVEKADARAGGAGTETLIISPKVYADNDPTGKDKKFIPIIMGRDPDGKTCVPAYLDGRLYFDFSNGDEIDHDEFEKLIRYLYGKPELRAPSLGAPPSYVVEAATPYFGATSKCKDAINALKSNKPTALVYCEDFFDQVYEALDGLLVEYNNNTEIVAEEVWNKINDMLPLRNECIEIIDMILRYKNDDQAVEVIKKILEKLLSYRIKRPVNNVYNEVQTNHYSFFIYEIFTYLIALMIEYRKFGQISAFLRNYYYENNAYSSGLTDFGICYPADDVFVWKNTQQGKKYLSFRAVVVKNRCNYKRIDFEKLMQVDLLLYICHLSAKKDSTWWYPRLLVYAGNQERPFELFARAISKKFFNDTFVKLGITEDVFRGTKEELGNRQNHYHALDWANLVALSNVDKIATKD